MRPWPVLMLPLLLAACGNSPWARLGGTVWDGVVDQLTPVAPPLEDLPESEGRGLRLWVNGRPSHAVLLQEIGERRVWRTAAGVVVATEGGRVIATAGLGQMLAATRFEGPDPLASPAVLLDHPAEARRLVDLMAADREPDGMRFGVALDCRLRADRTADAEVLLVQERCRTAGRSGFTNRFWVEAEGGAVLRAEQWVGPRVPMLTIEFLAPATTDGQAEASAGPHLGSAP